MRTSTSLLLEVTKNDTKVKGLDAVVSTWPIE